MEYFLDKRIIEVGNKNNDLDNIFLQIAFELHMCKVFSSLYTDFTINPPLLLCFDD